MNDKEYVRKEAEILYNFMIEDGERFSNKKQVYARIFNSIKGIVQCQIGDMESLDLSLSEIKEIIKEIVDNNSRKIDYK